MDKDVDALQEIRRRQVRAPLTLARFGAIAHKLDNLMSCGSQLRGELSTHATAGTTDGENQRANGARRVDSRCRGVGVKVAQTVQKLEVLDELVLAIGEDGVNSP